MLRLSSPSVSAVAVPALLVVAIAATGWLDIGAAGESNLIGTAGPFVVLGNWSGQVWLYSLEGDSVGPGSLVHVFQDAAASGLAVIDHGRDGDLDILAMVQPKDPGGALSGDTDIYMIENNGSGFDVSVIPDTIGRSGGFWFPMSDICAEDFLKDGYDDFVVSVTGDARTRLHLFVFDPGSGIYKQSFLDDTPWASHSWLIDAGDVHNDASKDFVTFDYPSTGDFADEVFVYRGDGLAGFSSSFACSTIHSVNDIAVGDYDNDGCADFAAGVDDDGDPGAVWLYLGDNSGSFRLISRTPVFDLDPIHNMGEDRSGTGHMDSYDVDQDGNLDLLAFVYGTSSPPHNPSLWLIRGNGDGSFQPPVKLREGIGDLSIPLALATAFRFELRPSKLSIDVKPRSCPNPLNVKSKGVLPVAILGTGAFDVAEIDVSTVMLEGVQPIRTAVEDVSRPVGGGLEVPSSATLGGSSAYKSAARAPQRLRMGSAGAARRIEGLPVPTPGLGDSCDCTTEGPDGYEDLTLKFERQEIVAALGEVRDRDTLVVRVTAQLLNGDELEGWDCVVIIDNEEKKAGRKDPGRIQMGATTPDSPVHSGLEQNHPNPFRKRTNLTFSLREGAHARLTVQDLAGRCVATLIDATLPAGTHESVWETTHPPGMYIVRLEAGGLSEAVKVVLLE